MAAKKNRRSKQKKKGVLRRLFSALFWLLILVTLLLAGTYFFGSVELRSEIERRTAISLYSIRDTSWVPGPLADFLATLEDQVPNTEIFVVDAEEAGRDGSEFIAGIPRGDANLTLLRRGSHSTLYDEHRRIVSVAARIADTDNKDYPMQWDNEVWSALIQTLAQNYPKRFEEIWLYTGPIYPAKGSAKPMGFYAIAFDMTEGGGLRAISFQVPGNALNSDLSTYLSSISAIEKATSLRFVPDLQIGTQQSLSNWKESRIW